MEWNIRAVTEPSFQIFQCPLFGITWKTLTKPCLRVRVFDIDLELTIPDCQMGVPPNIQ